MNRFLTRKKERNAPDDTSVNSLATSGTKKAKKWKKGQPEPKVEMDLTVALPSTDNFRTSLIMPNLSARFSMLREQDDPNSKIGKACDDSVLQPKRQSRLHDFGFVPGGLSDIAEVSSINGSIRPPFAFARQDSMDGYGTDDDSQSGSVMSRARPGEGNVLFGGRQKIYKIPASGSLKSLGSGNGMGGRALYDDDVAMSAFQKLRQQEREKEREKELSSPEKDQKADDIKQSEPSSPVKDVSYSPSLSGYNQRRETSSSTNSGPSNTRSSTAATSIASQGASSVSASSPAVPSAPSSIPLTTGLDRSTTKARRLYDQGLDQHIHDQQSSAMSRLNSIQKQRAPTGRSTPPFLSQAKSATNLNDRFARPGAQFRAGSPTPSAPMNNFGSIGTGKDSQSSSSSPVISHPQSPPMSPLGSDSDENNALQSALQPNDRGKATAMGAFNKPKQQFDEQQYAQRLKQMQQGRQASPPRPGRLAKPTLRERAELEQRKRAEFGASDPPRSAPVEKKEAPSAFSVFQNAANQMRAGSTQSPRQQQPVSERRTTFFASPGDSSEEEVVHKTQPVKLSELDRRLQGIQPPAPLTTRPAPPILEHPALRSRNNSQLEKANDHTILQSRPSTDANPRISGNRSSLGTVVKPDDADIDSPTLGPNNSGLSGLVRQHLRNPSSVSSVCGDASVAPLALRTQDVGLRRGQPNSEADTPAHSSYSHSNPWDLEDFDGAYYGEADSISSTSPTDSHKPKARSSNAGIPAINSEYPNLGSSEDSNTPHWEQELRKKHTRGASTETQQEREAFANELAQRQRAIQESLRNKVDSDNSRSASPAPAVGSLKNALGMLRSKSSRDSMATGNNKQDSAPKAIKMLGLGGLSASTSTTSLAGSSERFYANDYWRSEEDRVGQRGPASRPKPSRVPQQSEQDARRELEQRLQRSASEENSRDPRSTKGRSPPASSRSSTRNRSSSEVSAGRSRSRTGRYRDDLEKAMVEGTGSSASIYSSMSPSIPQHMTSSTRASPSPEFSQDSAAAPQQGRLRSNSRSTAANYFDQKSLHPLQVGHSPMLGSSPRLSPAANSPTPGLSPGLSPGLPLSPRPPPGPVSPGVNSFRPSPSPTPFSANSTPPISASTTPVASSFGSNGTMPSSRVVSHRKKSIQKSDISEPVFISATSVMDTIDLPTGASIRSGLEQPPPVPPLNPMRRRFGFGRSETHDAAVQPPQPPFAEPYRTASADETDNRPRQTRHKLRKSMSEGRSLNAKANLQAPVISNQAMPSHPFGGANGLPPHPIADGAMF